MTYVFLLKFIADLVRLQSRQYSLDGRRWRFGRLESFEKRVHYVYLTLEISPFSMFAKGFYVFKEVIIHDEGDRQYKCLLTMFI